MPMDCVSADGVVQSCLCRLQVVLDFMEARVWDSSALEAVKDVSERFDEAGKSVHLRHLSKDCKRILSKADDLIEVSQ